MFQSLNYYVDRADRRPLEYLQDGSTQTLTFSQTHM